MNKVYKVSLLGLFLIISTMVQALGPEQIFTKNIKKEFPISANGTCKISNKYGEVVFKNWEGNKVRIDVLISLKSNSTSTAQKSLDNITIDFESSAALVSAITNMEDSNSSWGSNKVQDLSIDYKVYLPSTVCIDVSNKYGSILIQDHSAAVSMNLKHGDAIISMLKGDLNLELGHGKLSAGKIQDLSGSISYSDVSIALAEQINLNSKYTDYSIPKADQLILNSKYDEFIVGAINLMEGNSKYTDYKIGVCESIILEAQYTDLEIEMLKDKAKLNMRYGDTAISNLAKGFGDIRLTGKYTDFSLGLEEGSNYQFFATGDYAGIEYPSALRLTYNVEKRTYQEVEGYVGVQGSRSKIQAKLDYGGLKIHY